MSRYPIDALLRPPVEFWSTLVAGMGAVIALLAPWALMMTPDVAVGAAVLLALLALVRARQGWRVRRYQRNLRRLPTYRLPADKIPVSHQKLFLGRGFRWTQTHTQRLADTLRPQVQRYVEPHALCAWARRMETQWEHTPGLRWVAEALALRAWWNPLAPRPPLGGKAVLHGVEPHEHAVWMPLRERVGHTLVLGTTRVGKTRLAEVLITQDIHRGDVVIVFDPKGDADLFRRMWAEARWLCLAMDRDAVEQVAHFRELTSEQQALLLAARKEPPKYTEGAVLGAHFNALARIVSTPLALALAMTEQDEKNARARIMRERGCSELEAAYAMAKQLAERRG